MDMAAFILQILILMPKWLPVGGSADAKRLYDDLLMKGYDSNVRPTTKYSDSTIINFGLRLSQIVAMDEVNQIMTANFWAEQMWIDPRLAWDVRHYNNITMLFVPAERLWRPDLVLYNNADGDYTITDSGKAVIYPDGRVTYTPPMQFKSSCEINVEYFPFDEQLCPMKFGPWTHDASKVDVVHLSHSRKDTSHRELIYDGVTLKDYQQSVEWDIMKATAQENHVSYPCCPGQYFSDVTFFVTLRRKHLYYVINLIIPCLSMNILTILAFYLPSYSGEKIGITISVFLSLSIFQMLLFDVTPKSSLNLPLIGKYIVVTSFLVSISVICNTVVLNMNHRMSSTHEMSQFVRWLFLRILSRLLYMRLPTDTNSKPEPKKLLSCNKSNYMNLSSYDNVYTDDSDTPRKQTQDESIGFDVSKWTMENSCKVCLMKRLRSHSPNAQKGFDGLCFIAKHYNDDDQSNRVKDEWRYVALVFDRILLLLYIIITLVITMEIFMNAPALYDTKQPI